MSVYDGRLAHIHDTDIFYADGLSLGTTTSWVSNTIDLGRDQAFVNQTAHIFWKISANFSLLSSISLCGTGVGNAVGGGIRSFMRIQDSADGSTWAGSILIIPVFDPVSAVSGITIVNATTLNALNVGIGSIKRYSRLLLDYPTAASVTIKAWLRMGLTA
jgi:hypothetical protein